MTNFFLVFGLVFIIFLVLASITFYGDEMGKLWGAWMSSRERKNADKAVQKERIREEAEARERAKQAGVDFLAEQQAELHKRQRAARYKQELDWELEYAIETGEYEKLLEAQQRHLALEDGRNKSEVISSLDDLVALPRELRTLDQLNELIRANVPDAYYERYPEERHPQEREIQAKIGREIQSIPEMSGSTPRRKRSQSREYEHLYDVGRR